MKIECAVILLVVEFCLSSTALCQDIFEAVKKGDLTATRNALDKNPELVDSADRYSLSPLHWATLRGYRDVAELLLAKGANIDQKTRLARTPLNIAVQHNHKDMVEFLRQNGADQSPWQWPVIQGEYLGEEKPGSSAKLFSPEIVSSIVWDHGAPSFSADGQGVFWSRVFDDGTGFILSMQRIEGKWKRLEVLPFSRPRFRDVSPVLSADGSRIYFQSCRPVEKESETPEYNIWFAERQGDVWGKPRLLDADLSSGKDGRPIVLKNGTFYFCSWREGETNHIYRSKFANGRYETPEKLEASFNEDVIPTWVSDDETWMTFESSRPGGFGKSDFWLSVRKGGVWQEPINLGRKINSPGREGFGSFSPDGRYFFFGSDREGNGDIYWIDAKIIDELRPKDLK